MIQLSSAGKRYGHKLLFEGVDWLITPKDRIGLVGANGTGKSTLLKVLGGLETLDYGSISIAKGISAGYLPQDGLTLSGRTVFAECMSVFSKLRAMEEEMEQLTASMSELDHASAEYAQVADRYQRVEHEFQARDGYAIEAQVGSVLTGLGFRKDDWDRQTDEFSGGWQMRIALAKLLLTARQLARIEILLADDLKAVEDVGDDRSALVLLDVPVRERHVEVLGDREISEQVVLLKHEADVLLVDGNAVLRAHRVDRVAEAVVLSAPCAVDHPDDAEQRGLARARWPHHGDELTVRDVERDAPKNVRAAGRGVVEFLD